ncbi:hypothetical protein K461DRAFT_279100 [Myriangium duriaei CBS 260.36]|uniref:Uncharacterized protein n=1 Tax=Myriangium duriaei CBS 260.36 TaxID=1168546 RepID=A0A9P4MFZ0_9PEZI|nr:hypothetical protein K461DRAFT_279100 [Myriangium duriaei CBS 260.36]
MDANERGRLTLQNPFYLDYHRLKTVYGVQIIRTPTLLSFAQLQNFFLSYAIDHSLGSFFWSHMDVIAISDELDQHAAIDNGFTTYQSLYLRAVETLRTHTSPNAEDKRWAAIFFAYDRLTLVNVKSYVDVGGWDTQIPFYGTDCDMHSRLSMAGWHTKELYTGLIYDIGHSLPDLGILYRPTVSNKATERGDSGYTDLLSTLDALQRVKNEQASGRNTWQGQQRGGHGEPFYRDPRGFEDAMRMTHDFGRSVFAEKWGHRDCDLEAAGLALDDQWKVTRDWESC